MARPDLYRLLENPFIYSLSQKVLAPGSEILKKKYEEVFKESIGLILDIGCGPFSSMPLQKGKLIGIDISIHYIKKYTSDDQRDGVVCSSVSLPFIDDLFNETRCSGLLHHLPSDMVMSTIREIVRCTRENGKIFIFDNVFPRFAVLRPVAWLTRKFDRGKWVRTEEELFQIVKQAQPGNWTKERFTYSFTGLEALCLSIEKSVHNNI